MFDDDELDSEEEDLSFPLKFHLTKEIIDFQHGLKWERARVLKVSFPRDYLEDILMSTEGPDVTLSLQTRWPIYIDFQQMPGLPEQADIESAEDTDELIRSQAEALEAKKAGKVN